MNYENYYNIGMMTDMLPKYICNHINGCKNKRRHRKDKASKEQRQI